MCIRKRWGVLQFHVIYVNILHDWRWGLLILAIAYHHGSRSRNDFDVEMILRSVKATQRMRELHMDSGSCHVSMNFEVVNLTKKASLVNTLVTTVVFSNNSTETDQWSLPTWSYFADRIGELPVKLCRVVEEGNSGHYCNLYNTVWYNII